MPRQKQLSTALQRIDSKKPRLLQLSTDLSSSGLPGVQFHWVLLLLCIHVQIFDVHTVIVIHACTSVPRFRKISLDLGNLMII